MHALDLVAFVRNAGVEAQPWSEARALLDLAALQLDPRASWARIETAAGPAIDRTPKQLAARWGWPAAAARRLLRRLQLEGRLRSLGEGRELTPFRLALEGDRVAAAAEQAADPPADLFPETVPPRQEFRGAVIRLDHRALRRLAEDYPHLRDLRAELATLDAYYDQTLAPGERHGWRFRYRQALNKRNHACAGKAPARAEGHPFGADYRPLGAVR